MPPETSSRTGCLVAVPSGAQLAQTHQLWVCSPSRGHCSPSILDHAPWLASRHRLSGTHGTKASTSQPETKVTTSEMLSASPFLLPPPPRIQLSSRGGASERMLKDHPCCGKQTRWTQLQGPSGERVHGWGIAPDRTWSRSAECHGDFGRAVDCSEVSQSHLGNGDGNWYNSHRENRVVPPWWSLWHDGGRKGRELWAPPESP